MFMRPDGPIHDGPNSTICGDLDSTDRRQRSNQGNQINGHDLIQGPNQTVTEQWDLCCVLVTSDQINDRDLIEDQIQRWLSDVVCVVTCEQSTRNKEEI